MIKKYWYDGSLGRIAVQESAGEEGAVFLVHGNSLSADSFRYQLAGQPGKRWRLIAFDLPGHGSSPAAESPRKTYSLAGYSIVLRELISSVGARAPVLIGHSLGGHIALEAIAGGCHAVGLLLSGTPPLASANQFSAAFHSGPVGGYLFKGSLEPTEIAVMAASLVRPQRDPPEYFRTSVAATDPAAREFLGVSFAQDPLADEQAVVERLDIPIAILHGEYDQIVNLDYIRRLDIPTLWRGTPQIVHSAGHSPQYEQPGRFNELLAEFLAELPTCRS